MTGKEYFAMLNEVEQEQFEINFAECRLTDDDLEFYLLEEYDNFDEFISCAFLFEKTQEGGDYWREIRDSQRDGIDASDRRKSPKSMHDFLEKLLFLAFVEGATEPTKDSEGESLDEILSNLKIKLSEDDEV